MTTTNPEKVHRGWVRWLCRFCAVAGALLLCVNVYGALAPETHPKARDFRATPEDPIFLGADRALHELGQLSRRWNDLPYEDRMRETARIFSAAIVHYWVDTRVAHEPDPELELALHQNWFLYLTSDWSKPERYYEYYDYRPAIRRGVGWCSQAAKAVSDYLREEHGLSSGLIFLDGHVVAYVTNPDDQTQSVLDADYGVYLPFDLAHAEQHPEEVRAIYEQAGVAPATAQAVAEFYAQVPNDVRKPLRYYNKEARRYRTALYMKWIVPALLLLAAFGMRRAF